MKTEQDQSYGVVPLLKEAGGWQVLLIEQIGRRGDRFWTLPKGHAEGTETPRAAAARELAEETGITDVILQESPVFTTQYAFVHQQVHIEKRVDYFIGWCTTAATRVTQPHEVAQLRWCTFDRARTLLPHQNTQTLLRQVSTYLDETE